MADASGHVVEFNPAAERTFGYTRDEARGRMLAELIVPPSLRELHSKAFARFVETREKRLFGCRLELTGGELTDAKRAKGDLRWLADEQSALCHVATTVAKRATAIQELHLGDVGNARALDGGTEQMEVWT